MKTRRQRVVSRRHLPAGHDIWVLVYPGFLLLDATGPLQVFATSNDEASDAKQPLPYRLHLVSRSGGEVSSSAGIRVLTRKLPSVNRLKDASLIVSGGQNMTPIMQDKTLLRWLVRAHNKLRRCCAVCSGALLLAQAGLLQNRRAVTHWRDVAYLKRHFPEVRVQDDAIYLKDGSIYTSAGITAGIDLCLSLVEEDLGRRAALNVAKRLVMYHKRPGGQRQFSSELLAQASLSDLVTQLTAWLKPRLQKTISVEQMASAMALSSRSLHRRLRSEANITPAQLLTRLRMERACRLLEDSTLSLKSIASKSGFGSEYNLRRAFLMQLGVLPSEYRERFG